MSARSGVARRSSDEDFDVCPPSRLYEYHFEGKIKTIAQSCQWCTLLIRGHLDPSLDSQAMFFCPAASGAPKETGMQSKSKCAD
jgi:hypothetical protein